MKKNKLIIGLLVAGAVGFYIYKKNKNKNFFNFGEIETSIVQPGTRDGQSIGQKYCEVVSGNAGVVGMALSNNRIIVRTGNGTTTICPRGQQYDLPR